MKDIRLTQLPNGRLDILLTDGKSEWCEDGIQAVQHAILRLMKIKTESVTDNPDEEGTDFYGIIFNMKKSRAEKEFHLKKRILDTPGINKIERFEWTQSGRNVTINALVLTDWGNESIGTTVTAL